MGGHGGGAEGIEHLRSKLFSKKSDRLESAGNLRPHEEVDATGPDGAQCGADRGLYGPCAQPVVSIQGPKLMEGGVSNTF